jgi:ADP-ribose pyrophosphatase YjhB (NUDIX family)
LAIAVLEGRERMRCTVCAFVLYENPACAAAGMVVDELGRILLVRRAIEPWRGHWALPAGYQEVDEEPARTAAREVAEESGIEVEVVELVDLLYVPANPVKAANLAVYRCRRSAGPSAAEPTRWKQPGSIRPPSRRTWASRTVRGSCAGSRASVPLGTGRS